MRKILTISAIFLSLISSFAANKQTFLYASKGDQQLYLDYYQVDTDNSAPCLIYMFGGGFMFGERDREFFSGFFEYINSLGYNVASIDYRLGLKELDFKVHKGLKALDMFENAVQIAVEDLFSATAYLIEHAEELNLDPKRIVSSGSSAGAITVLTGENHICNATETAQILPNGFNYAGTICFAGAIYSRGALHPKWPMEPCPILFFHGDADSLVPYEKIELPLIAGIYGAKTICAQLKQINAPYYFYSAENRDHAMASAPLNENREQVGRFLKEFVEGKKRIQLVEQVSDLNLPVLRKNIGLSDIIQSASQRMN